MTTSAKLPTIEAAKHLGLTPRTLYNWRYLRKGPPYYMVGGKPVYDIRDLDQYLADRRIDPEAA
jgi:hypothetical protein